MNLSGIKILAEGQNIQLSGNSLQTNPFTLGKTLNEGGKIRFKIRYSAELHSFGLLEVFLINAQTGLQVASMAIPSDSLQNAEKEQDFNLWEAGDYYFYFKMTSGSGTFTIKDYKLYWKNN